MSLKSLVNDPEFQGLSPDEQKQAIVSVEPQASNLGDGEYNVFLASLKQPTLKEDLTPSTNHQKSGPIISPKGLVERLKPKKEDIPELLGTTIGGMSGGIPGAMLGGAAGNAVKQLGQRAGFFEGKAPQTSMDALDEATFGALRGGAAEVGGKVIGKVLSPFSGSITTEIKTGLEAAKRAGIKPSLSQITDSQPVQALDRFAEFSWPFGSEITKQKQLAVKQLEDYTEKIANGIGPDLPPELVGETAKAKVTAFEKAFKSAKEKLYAPINAALNDKPVNPMNTIAAIQDVLDQKAGGKEGQALLKDWLERLTPGYEVPGMATEKQLPLFKQLKAIRTEIGSRGKFNDPGVTGLKSQLEGIYAAASKDMDNLAEQHGMGDALKEVNAQYSKGIKKLQDSLVTAINKRAEKSPESLYKLIVRQDSPTLIKTGKEILGQDGFNQIRTQWFDDLVNRSKSIVEGEEVISPAKLANNLRKMGSSLPEMFSDNPQLAAQIADLSDVSKLMTRGSKVTGGSQTGYIMGALRSLRGALAAPLVRTEAGREFLTTGFPRVGKFAGRIAQVGGQFGLQKASE